MFTRRIWLFYNIAIIPETSNIIHEVDSQNSKKSVCNSFPSPYFRYQVIVYPASIADTTKKWLALTVIISIW